MNNGDHAESAGTTRSGAPFPVRALQLPRSRHLDSTLLNIAVPDRSHLAAHLKVIYKYPTRT